MVTGGAGFIGSNYIHYILDRHENINILNYDKLTYAGNLDNLQKVESDPRYRFIKGDICDKKMVYEVIKKHEPDHIVNFAAETHVDRSITGPATFVITDVMGTFTLLEACRRYSIHRYIQISTDEVYGSAENGSFTEEAPLNPSSPYSASKASADLLVSSYFRTYGLPVTITRSSNNFGPYQYPEKLIPLFIIKALQNKKLPVYGNGQQVRDWLYVRDNCEAIDTVRTKGKQGQIYNIGADNEHTNLKITNIILEELNKPNSLIEHIQDRPGHDRRYSVESNKIQSLGWQPKKSQQFHQAMKATIQWYTENEWWWKKLL